MTYLSYTLVKAAPWGLLFIYNNEILGVSNCV